MAMLDIQDLVLASANKGKIKELQDMLGGLGINIIPQQQLGIEEGGSIVEEFHGYYHGD